MGDSLGFRYFECLNGGIGCVYLFFFYFIGVSFGESSRVDGVGWKLLKRFTSEGKPLLLLH